MSRVVEEIRQEELRFWCRLSIRDDVSARESLRRYRAYGGRIGDARFYEVYNDVKRGMLR